MIYFLHALQLRFALMYPVSRTFSTACHLLSFHSFNNVGRGEQQNPSLCNLLHFRIPYSFLHSSIMFISPLSNCLRRFPFGNQENKCYEECSLLICDAMRSGRSALTLQMNCFSTLMMEADSCCERSIRFYHSLRLYLSE